MRGRIAAMQSCVAQTWGQHLSKCQRLRESDVVSGQVILEVAAHRVEHLLAVLTLVARHPYAQSNRSLPNPNCRSEFQSPASAVCAVSYDDDGGFHHRLDYPLRVDHSVRSSR